MSTDRSIARQILIDYINEDREAPGAYRPFDAMKEDLVYNLIEEQPNMAKLVLRLHASDVEYCTINNRFYDDVQATIKFSGNGNFAS